MSDELSGATVAAADPGGMLGDVLAQPHQLGDALWRAESAGIRSSDLPGGLVVSVLSNGVLGKRRRHPFSVSRLG